MILDAGNARTLLFTLAVGSLIVLLRESGGVTGFATWMVERGWVRGRRSAQLLSMALGISIFIESNITCLITGTVSRPLYDRVGLSRAKLAYVCDSTSAPMSRSTDGASRRSQGGGVATGISAPQPGQVSSAAALAIDQGSAVPHAEQWGRHSCHIPAIPSVSAQPPRPS